jgi:hypothetical protein
MLVSFRDKDEYRKVKRHFSSNAKGKKTRKSKNASGYWIGLEKLNS